MEFLTNIINKMPLPYMLFSLLLLGSWYIVYKLWGKQNDLQKEMRDNLKETIKDYQDHVDKNTTILDSLLKLWGGK